MLDYIKMQYKLSQKVEDETAVSNCQDRQSEMTVHQMTFQGTILSFSERKRHSFSIASAQFDNNLCIGSKSSTHIVRIFRFMHLCEDMPVHKVTSLQFGEG